MPQRNVASNFTFEQQRVEINNLAQDFWTHKTGTDTAAPTYLKHDGSNDFTGQTLAVPNAFTINSNSGNGTVTISGNLQVDGTTTTVNTATMDVVDKNITIAKGSANDAAADGAGITIDSATDITFNFVDAKDALVSSIGLEGTTFLKAPYGQFTGSGTPGGGQGVEINAPDTNTGQIASYDRANTAYKQLNIKGSSVQLYAGTSNAIVGTFNSTGLAVAAASAAVTIQATNPSNTSTSTLKFKNLDGNSNYRDVVTIDGESTGNGGYGAFVVKTAFNNSLIERLRIDQNGNTNFGAEKAVAFPSGTGIQVYHSANPRIKLTNDTTGNAGTDGTQIYLSTDGDTIIDNKDGEDIIFHTNAVEKFRIKNTATGAFLAIGNSTNNSSIASTFQVIADDGEAEDLYVGVFKNLEATAGKSYGVNVQAGSNATDHGFRVKNKDNNETHLLVRGDGRVVIGEDQPADKLVVQGSTASGDIGIRVKNDTVTDGDNANPTSASLYLNTSTGNFNTFYIQARRNDNNTHFGYADPRTVGHVPNMCIANTGQVLIGSGTENTSDRFTIMDPGNAFMSLRSDAAGDGVSQHLDFIVTDAERSSTNMVGAIRAQIPTGSTAGGTLKGELSLWTNAGNNITEQVTIKSDGHVLLNHGGLVINDNSSETDFGSKSLPAADSGLYIRNGNGTTGTYSSIGLIASSSGASSDQSASLVVKCTASGLSPEVYLTQRDGNNSQRNTLAINTLGDATFIGNVSDYKGNLRRLAQNNQSGGYNLVAADAGTHINTSGDIGLYTGQFVVGDAIVIFNKGTADILIGLGGGVTMYQAGTTNVGNRTLAAKGICTILCTEQGSGTNTFVISGAGLS